MTTAYEVNGTRTNYIFVAVHDLRYICNHWTKSIIIMRKHTYLSTTSFYVRKTKSVVITYFLHQTFLLAKHQIYFKVISQSLLSLGSVII